MQVDIRSCEELYKYAEDDDTAGATSHATDASWSQFASITFTSTADDVWAVISDAAKHASNPAFYLKLAFVALAVVTLRRIWTQVFRSHKSGRFLAAASLGCWVIALSAGRLMAYIIEFIL